MKRFTFKFSALLMLFAFGIFLSAQAFNVTFNVDMTNADEFNPETDDIYISGSFVDPEWPMPGSEPSLKMEPTEDNPMIYTITLEIAAGDIAYKYFRVIDEPTWDLGEWGGDPNRVATITGDRVINEIWGDPTSSVKENMVPVFSLSPNPVQNILFISNLEKAGKVEIYNMVGKLVQTIDNISTPELKINTSGLKGGVYFVSVYTREGVQTMKFVKK